jgi:hypothetical protein
MANRTAKKSNRACRNNVKSAQPLQVVFEQTAGQGQIALVLKRLLELGMTP